MSEEQERFTPGPWVAVEHTSRPSKFDYHPDGLWHVHRKDWTSSTVPIAIVDHHRDAHEPTRKKSEWDARLIAAAPDMVSAALLATTSSVDVSEDTFVVSGAAYRALRAAIARALGEGE